MPEITVLVVGEDAPQEAPSPLVADIWPRAGAILRHFAQFNTDEAKVAALQYGILTTGTLAVPSIWHDGTDVSHRSYALHDRIFYHFAAAAEPYFWITAQLDRCYDLGVLYLPARRIALSLYPYTADPPLLAAFEAMRLQAPAAPAAPPGPPLGVAGHPHMMHHLWNELPAIDRALATGLQAQLRLAVTHQPLGPLEAIFPELRGQVTAMTAEAVTALNGHEPMFTALGAWSIPVSTQRRVIAVAGEQAPAALAAAQARFRSQHAPIFWISVKPPPRSCMDQAATLAALIAGLQARYRGAGFLLDGVSYPWDYGRNPNYLGWFDSMITTAASQSAAIMDEVLAALPRATARHVRRVTGVPVLEEIGWAGLADFYICHGGSMQNKIGWLYPTPGVVHSNTSFMAGARGMIPPVERPGIVTFVPDALVIDDDPAGYTPLQLARKDQSYHFASQTALLDIVLARCAEAVPEPPRGVGGLAAGVTGALWALAQKCRGLFGL